MFRHRRLTLELSHVVHTHTHTLTLAHTRTRTHAHTTHHTPHTTHAPAKHQPPASGIGPLHRFVLGIGLSSQCPSDQRAACYTPHNCSDAGSSTGRRVEAGLWRPRQPIARSESSSRLPEKRTKHMSVHEFTRECKGARINMAMDQFDQDNLELAIQMTIVRRELESLEKLLGNT